MKGRVSRLWYRLLPVPVLALLILALVSPSINLLVFGQTSTPIQRVHGPALGVWSSGDSFSVALPNTPARGDILVCTFGDTTANGFGTISAISNANGKITWTKQLGNNYHDVYYYDSEIWYGTVNAVGASNTIVITLVSANAAPYAVEAYVSEYNGMATSGFLDRTASNQGTGFTTDSGTTTTTMQVNELWIASIVASAPQSSPTNGFGLVHYTSTACDLGNFEKIANTTGIANAGANMNSVYEHDYVGCIATFFAGGGASVTVTTVTITGLILVPFVGLIAMGVLVASGTLCIVLLAYARRMGRKR